MYNYNGLLKLLKQNKLCKSDLTKLLHISSRTIAKISRGEKLSSSVIRKLCDFFHCSEEDLYTIICDNPLLRQLREEKDYKISGGLYHELQIRMTYNSNHIEGSQLSEEQTRLISETSTIDTQDGVPVDDILETVHHFRAIDYVIEHAEDLLSEEIIKHIHYILKHDTKDSTLSWFSVGDYKKRANMVGGRETAKPSEVAGRIKKLLENYNAIEKVSIEDIISFHAEFEYIHPFQDGNGRVGRLIILKECLRHNIIPFLIEDKKKNFYYRGLNEWHNERGWLIDTCLDSQDSFSRLLSMLEIPNS